MENEQPPTQGATIAATYIVGGMVNRFAPKADLSRTMRDGMVRHAARLIDKYTGGPLAIDALREVSRELHRKHPGVPAARAACAAALAKLSS